VPVAVPIEVPFFNTV
jgi:hypothetical protein